jgi:hypothetical protein
MKTYEFGGWANFSREGFFPQFVAVSTKWDMKITYSYEIKICLDRHALESARIYHKYHVSSSGFTLGKIFSLINETYFSFIDSCYDGNENFVSDLVLDGFQFDEETNSIYPRTSS